MERCGEERAGAEKGPQSKSKEAPLRYRTDMGRCIRSIRCIWCTWCVLYVGGACRYVVVNRPISGAKVEPRFGVQPMQAN